MHHVNGEQYIAIKEKINKASLFESRDYVLKYLYFHTYDGVGTKYLHLSVLLRKANLN